MTLFNLLHKVKSPDHLSPCPQGFVSLELRSPFLRLVMFPIDPALPGLGEWNSFFLAGPLSQWAVQSSVMGV